MTTTPAPALPDDVLLQLYVPRAGVLYRVSSDGRFLVTPPGGSEHEERPMSKLERGRATISELGLGRLRDALHEAGFFALPDEVVTSDCVPEGSVLRNSGKRITRQPLIFSARDDGRVRTVEAHADLRAPCTLGALQPVYRAFDEEALGDWMNE